MRNLVAIAVSVAAAVAMAGAPATNHAPAAGRYLAMFDDLVQRIERTHSFAPGYEREVGHAWRDDIPRLRDEFARATDAAQALIALRHLQNSLRDRHCMLDPAADQPRRTLRLGVELWAGGTEAQPELRVARIRDPAITDVAVGDTVTAVDGLALPAWLAAHPFESFELARDRHARDTLLQIARVDLPWSGVRAGDRRTLTIVHDGVARDVALAFRDDQRTTREPDLDHAPAMASLDCGPSDYGDYALSDVGINYCVYRPRSRGPRIVRYRSFVYAVPDTALSLRMAKADHDGLARALRGADSVILDVHENNGGNNPFLFLGWFARGPWDHPRVTVRVDPALDDATVLRLFEPPDAARYFDAQRARRPTLDLRFLCARAPCTRVQSPASELVTTAPVALLVGPACASSCDTVAALWATFKLGPIVGKQPAHGYTVFRVPLDVTAPDGQRLGRLRVALSRSELPDGTPIEGEPLALDWLADDRFDARATWVKDAVREAAARLRRTPSKR